VKRFTKLLKDEQDIFLVPGIIDEASGAQVLTMERMEGLGVTKSKISPKTRKTDRYPDPSPMSPRNNRIQVYANRS
jgi:predicted unusual protein kinase regulating ubiquinone biosynthesis (AarF/ABC1/UbiB family)